MLLESRALKRWSWVTTDECESGDSEPEPLRSDDEENIDVATQASGEAAAETDDTTAARKRGRHSM